MSDNLILEKQDTKEDVRLQVTRVIRARRKDVFDAWTKPELMRRWFAPGTMTVAYASADLRIDGAYRVEMKGADDYIHVASGVYKKIIPGELLAFTWSASCDQTADTLVTVEFKMSRAEPNWC